jgi:hypothetical protein
MIGVGVAVQGTVVAALNFVAASIVTTVSRYGILSGGHTASTMCHHTPR